MKFSIITINYKSENLTIGLLKGLSEIYHDTPMEIIVVDNGSDSNVLEEFIEKTGTKIKLIKNQNNLGFAQANNQGAQASNGEFLVFLNNDSIIKDDFINPGIKTLEQNKNLGAISPKILNINDQQQKMSYGKFPSLKEILKIKLSKELKLNQNNNYTLVDWISGCSLVIQRGLFNKLGGWDNNFFLYYEDVDICKRLQQANYKVAVCNQCSINHLENGSPMKTKERKKYYYQSQDYYFKKHHSKFTQKIIKGIRFFYIKYKLLKTSIYDN